MSENPKSDSFERDSYEQGSREIHEEESYRIVSRSAIVSLIFGFLSTLAFASVTFAVLPLIGLVLAVIGISKIKRFPDELVGKKIAFAGLILCLITFAGSLSRHAYIYATEVPEGYDRITFRMLRPIDKEQDVFSKQAIDLHGKKVFLPGYVYPHLKKRGLEKFLLVRDKGTCCFGGDPKPYDCVMVNLVEGQTIDYSWRLRKLGGVFGIDRSVDSIGEVTSGYYRLQGDFVK